MAAWVKMTACVAATVCAGPIVFAPALARAEVDKASFIERVEPHGHWLVGVTLDRRVTASLRDSLREIEDDTLIGDQLFGVSALYQRRWLGLNGRLVFLPATVSPRTTVGMVLGGRALFNAFGRRWSYGVNLQGDAILGEHHAVLYVAPIELTFDIYTKRSFQLQVLVGARYAVTGTIISNVLIDPNGFAHPEFDATLANKLEHPWEATASLVFARRID